MSTVFSPRRFGAMFVKEVRQILRDPSTLLMAFVLPAVLIFLFGFGVNLDTARTRIGLSVEDRSEAASSLAASFQHSRFFEVAVVADAVALRRDLVTGHIRGFVVIPQDFGRAALRGGGEIQVVTDGSSPNTAAFVATYAEGVRQSWVAARSAVNGTGRAPPIQIDARFWFNPELSSRFFLVPGAVAVVMAIVGSLLTSLVIAREWERGTMEAIMATPVGPMELMATKVVPYFLLGLCSMSLCAVLAVWVFGVPFRGSVLGLLAIASAFLVPALGQGLFISSATKNQFMASQIALLTAFLPSMLLSGFLFEISSMPKWIQALTYILPVRYLIPPLQTVFVAGDDWSMFAKHIAIMLGFGVALFMLAIRATRWRIA
jgi:ABC-2 type transport system permease protein